MWARKNSHVTTHRQIGKAIIALPFGWIIFYGAWSFVLRHQDGVFGVL